MSLTTFVPGWSDRNGQPAVEDPVSLVRDVLCQRFDADWRENRRPAIEEFLADMPDAHRPELFRRLLRIELDWRQKRLETHTSREYLSRFPAFAATVREEFRLPATHVTDHWGRSPRDTEIGLPVAFGGPASPVVPLPEPAVRSAPPRRPASRPEPAASPERVGNYELLAELARGGMGVVYRARQIGLGRIVALKMIVDRSLADDEHRRRFRTEAEAAGRLNHPGLVPIYELGEHEGRLYYSMEFVEGRSLEQLVQRGPMSPAEAARIMGDVADAVHCAHQHGIIHRDLKPSNILVDSQGRPRVADFGLARHMTESIGTAPGQVLGTPSYMPPEQACGQIDSIGVHSDVYSLGATLYHLLTGRPPFLTASRHSTMHQVITAPPVPPSTFDASMPPDLERICLKCLEKSPMRRFTSAGDLAYELRRATAKGSPAPLVLPARSTWRRFLQSRIWMMAAAAAALGVGVYLALQ